MTTRAAEIRAGLSHPIIDADGHFVEVAPLLNEEMLAYLEEMGGREVRDRYARDTGLTDTSTVLAGHAGAAGAGWKAIRGNWKIYLPMALGGLFFGPSVTRTSALSPRMLACETAILVSQSLSKS
jgi:hypothetical protein